MRAVADSSPLILLAKIGRLSLLRSLFDEILVPEAVHAEIVGAGDRPGVEALRAAEWIMVRSVDALFRVADPLSALHRGEAEAIVLAQESPASTLLIVDDSAARRAARGLGVSVVGTAGLLVQAKEQGLISQVRPTLDELVSAGLYLDEPIYEHLLRTVGESASLSG